jgi:hypothetical protein
MAVLVSFCASLHAANPGVAPAPVERVALRSIAGWLKARGSDGYLGAGVARALGISRSEAKLDARQRGFRDAEALRIAQLLPDGSLLFMVQAADGEVTFYHSTAADGLRRALVSVPLRGQVVPLVRQEAQPRFLAEVLYWEDKAANR